MTLAYVFLYENGTQRSFAKLSGREEDSIETVLSQYGNLNTDPEPGTEVKYAEIEGEGIPLNKRIEIRPVSSGSHTWGRVEVEFRKMERAYVFLYEKGTQRSFANLSGEEVDSIETVLSHYGKLNTDPKPGTEVMYAVIKGEEEIPLNKRIEIHPSGFDKERHVEVEFRTTTGGRRRKTRKSKKSKRRVRKTRRNR